ncbi:MAG: MerR family transcriptional regulator [Sphingobacteriaceae bacterium]|nr:MerR family transcriptional regulator [Sphingobacteriaceae bacterium]
MQYSISDLEQLSGVHAHTIRMWEQRYNALVPHRSAGNTRYYDDEHLVKLLNIVSIHQKGLKISKICALSQDAIHHLIEEDIQETVSKNQQFEFYITQLLNFGMSYNEAAFDNLLSKCINDNTLTETYSSVIYPMLVRLGLMWRKDSICAAQEHFLTNIIRQKICAAINDLPVPSSDKKTWVLFLPQDEEHEIGVLFANYLLRQAGKRVIYLGSRVPLSSVKEVVKLNKVDSLMLFMVQAKLTNEAQKYIDEISVAFKKTKIYLAGSQKLIENIQLPKGIQWLRGINEFEVLVNDFSC